MNFALILFLLCLITGALWLSDVVYFRKRRAADAPDPVWVEWGAGFFPVILLVFGLRSFVVEPFKIPSGSMIPTLQIGDFIVVNKYTYGIRLPVLNKKIIELGSPKRGDVIVFRYPVDPDLDYIKRVVGLPGDKVVYRDKHLFINDKAVSLEFAGDFVDRNLRSSQSYTEDLGLVQHKILLEPRSPSYIPNRIPHAFSDNCQYNSEGVICHVPQGHYFVLGDNRDNSADSRVWGFVPEQNIVGKAFFVWFNSSFDFGRFGIFH